MSTAPRALSVSLAFVEHLVALTRQLVTGVPSADVPELSEARITYVSSDGSGAA
jgi:hypothetical protein